MGQELELKFSARDAAVLDRILADAAPAQTITMRTTYYDTQDGALSARKWMVRCRLENGEAVVCCKTPLPGSDVRGEWEIRADDVAAALPALVASGAPGELLTLGALSPRCTAAFTRRAVSVQLAPDCTAELACDLGELRGRTECLPLCEVELELKRGSAEALRRFAADFAARYDLTPEPRSKAARALSLR